MMADMKELTKAELQIMRVLWRIRSGFLKDLLDQFPDPKPAPTTVATVLRILVQKGFVGYTVRGKAHEYHAEISRERYARGLLKNVAGSLFSGSPGRLVSFFARESDLSLSELEELKGLLEREIEARRSAER